MLLSLSEYKNISVSFFISYKNAIQMFRAVRQLKFFFFLTNKCNKGELVVYGNRVYFTEMCVSGSFALVSSASKSVV